MDTAPQPVDSDFFQGLGVAFTGLLIMYGLAGLIILNLMGPGHYHPFLAKLCYEAVWAGAALAVIEAFAAYRITRQHHHPAH